MSTNRVLTSVMPGGSFYCVLEPPSRHDILRLRDWLRTAELPEPPMLTIPGVEALSPELTRRQLLAETDSEGGLRTAVLELHYLAARYGPPEIRALARPHQLPGDPRGVSSRLILHRGFARLRNRYWPKPKTGKFQDVYRTVAWVWKPSRFAFPIYRPRSLRSPTNSLELTGPTLRPLSAARAPGLGRDPHRDRH
jgi:hypothetical protein